ncbi:MAG TPA: hypothetical protein VK081_01825 [Planctomycetota bacterium]|nr:hypothetical protein [Planctomycetota bacterium]
MTGRAALRLAVAAAAIAAALAWWWLRADGPEDMPAPPPTVELGDEERRALAHHMAERVREREQASPVARSAVPAGKATGTVIVRVVDAATRATIEGARAIDLHEGEPCSTPGADGTLSVADLPPGRVAFAADGYLAKLPRPGDADAEALVAARRQGVAEIALQRDDFTLPCTLRFVGPDGEPLSGLVCYGVQCLDQPPPDALSFPTVRLAPGARVDRSLAEAWQRHVAVQPVLGEGAAPLHLGVHSHGRTFEATDGETTLRIVAAGRYRIDAVASEAGLAGSQDAYLASDARGPIVVRLQAGRFLHGIVVDAGDGQPVAGARLRLLGGAWTPHGEGETGTDGGFRLGPLPMSRVTVGVQSRRHLDLSTTAVVGEPQRLVLTPRPVRVVRGFVRRRPVLQPVEGAEVILRSGQETDARAVTGADGAFVLETALEVPELVVRAAGFLPWIERVDEAVEGYSCDLLPADAAGRLAAGLTAIVEGKVVDARGEPVAGIPVQLFADEVAIPEGIPGRAILEGHVLPLRPLAVTAADGTFELEWHRAGSVRLVAVDGTAQAEDGVPVTLVLGQRTRGIVLRP